MELVSGFPLGPRVVDVVPNNRDYTLTVTFDNGEVRLFDVKPYLNKGVFVKLQNPVYFITVSVLNGTVSWNDEQDFCPDMIYEKSTPI